ncbi:CTD kinase subunit gamma CTK3-domain-containing protein [Astrocystis sublimbata]|nr:CTD kinase subunit gamma CTK3-domain-containing protein [Astrocystis sublimbata]
MADPFEVRMRFSSQLEHLNASTASAQKAAQYALKFKDMDEDLHSCILEQLEKTNMNTRANIMYFIEHLLEMASREKHNDYVRMMQRDIIRVVDAVCPENGSGAANVKVVRKVLQGLQVKSVLLEQTVVEIESCLKARDTSATDFSLSSPVDGNPIPAAPAVPATDPDTQPAQQRSASANSMQPTKKQIEQRIEEDRERHKRMRERMWVVPSNPLDQATKFFAETSGLGVDDRILGDEDIAEFGPRVKGITCNRHRDARGSRREERPGSKHGSRPTNGAAARH